VKLNWRRVPRPVIPGLDFVRQYETPDGLRAMVGKEPAGKGGKLLWHISVSRERRHPKWEEIRDARYDLVPDEVTMAMLLPPKAEYVNVHEHCFHLWEVEDPRG